MRGDFPISLAVLTALAALLLTSCAPALNWRSVPLVSSSPDATAMFPCRPDREERRVALAGHGTLMRMVACHADGATFAIAIVEVSDDSAAESMMQELSARSTSNINGSESAGSGWRVSGQSRLGRRVLIAGRGPDGKAVVEHRASLFLSGRIYRLSVIGKSPSAETAEFFFAGLHISRIAQ